MSTNNNTFVASVHTILNDEIQHAIKLLTAGELVAFPTETVYGLGADAENPQAVARIFAAKGRPLNHPVIVHVSDAADVTHWVRELPETARRLIDAFWPGPLTLVMKKAEHIPAEVSGGQDTIGLRCPAHPIAQALLRAFKGGQGGLAAPSANRFGRISPTTARHVAEEFRKGTGPAQILDGGPCEIGIESTIVDLSSDTPVLLRPGRITSEQLSNVLGVPLLSVEELGNEQTAPRVSGTLKAHYAPRTPLRILSRDEIDHALTQLHKGEPIAVVARAPFPDHWLVFANPQDDDHPYVQFVAAPEDAHSYAYNFYSLLRNLDFISVRSILIETLPTTTEWAALNDRLTRAAAAFLP